MSRVLAVMRGGRGRIGVLWLAAALSAGCGHRHAAWQMAAELAARETGGDQRVRVDQVTIDASGMVEAQLCVDFYDYDDLPGHPSISCGRSMTYLAMLAPGGWITTRVQPVLIDCFVDWPPETTLPGEAEVGLPIPRWNDANRLAGSGPLRP